MTFTYIATSSYIKNYDSTDQCPSYINGFYKMNIMKSPLTKEHIKKCRMKVN
jgi:hypothetical protein